MTALSMSAAHQGNVNPRPVPWRRMAGIIWRQHRFALAGVAVLLGALALYLWLAGSAMHHAYAVAAACHPASSDDCQNQVIDFNTAYAPTAQTVGVLLMAVPMLIGAFVGASVLGRELETGTFRYAWTQGFGRRRWTLAKLVPLAVIVTVAAGLFSLLFSWYYQPLFTDGDSIPLDPKLFGVRGVAYAAWTLAAFAVGASAGLLIRRVVPAIAVTLAFCVALTFAAGLYLRPHYETPVLGRDLASAPVSAWVLNGWWTRGGTMVSQAAMNQVEYPLFQRAMTATVPKNVNSDDIKFYKGSANTRVQDYLYRHGYTKWTSYQPGSRFWPFQWIEGGWLLALSVLLIAATVWLVGRRAV
jgi:ABC-type transport system involved in multi-copper enzyme maturation permease subunit